LHNSISSWLPGLQVLRLSGNQLQDLCGLEGCTNLRVLEVSRNQLTDLQVMPVGHHKADTSWPAGLGLRQMGRCWVLACGMNPTIDRITAAACNCCMPCVQLMIRYLKTTGLQDWHCIIMVSISSGCC
jgi:hypothetical protein